MCDHLRCLILSCKLSISPFLKIARASGVNMALSGFEQRSSAQRHRGQRRAGTQHKDDWQVAKNLFSCINLFFFFSPGKLFYVRMESLHKPVKLTEDALTNNKLILIRIRLYELITGQYWQVTRL